MLFIPAEQALDHLHRAVFLKEKPGQSHSSTTEIILLQSTAIQNNFKKILAYSKEVSQKYEVLISYRKLTTTTIILFFPLALYFQYYNWLSSA